MAIHARMLQHGRFIFAKSICGSGGVLLKAGVRRSLSFSYICAGARNGAGSSTGNVVDDTYRLLFGKCVFRFYQTFSDGSARSDACADAFAVENTRKRLSESGIIGQCDVA